MVWFKSLFCVMDDPPVPDLTYLAVKNTVTEPDINQVTGIYQGRRLDRTAVMCGLNKAVATAEHSEWTERVQLMSQNRQLLLMAVQMQPAALMQSAVQLVKIHPFTFEPLQWLTEHTVFRHVPQMLALPCQLLLQRSGQTAGLVVDRPQR